MHFRLEVRFFKLRGLDEFHVEQLKPGPWSWGHLSPHLPSAVWNSVIIILFLCRILELYFIYKAAINSERSRFFNCKLIHPKIWFPILHSEMLILHSEMLKHRRLKSGIIWNLKGFRSNLNFYNKVEFKIDLGTFYTYPGLF